MYKNVIVIVTGLCCFWGGCGESPVFTVDGGADTDADTDGDTDSDTDADAPTIAPSDGNLPAADPKLAGFVEWPLSFAVDPKEYGSLACRVEIRRGEAQIASVAGVLADGVCAAAWNGLDAEGGWVATGPAAAVGVLSAEAGGDPLAEGEMAIEIVRLGIGQIQMAPAGAQARVALLWAETDGEYEGWWELAADDPPWRLGPDASEGAAAVDLELADGTPRPLPAVWTDVESPPLDDASADGVEHDTFNLPTAWVAGANIDFSATMSASTAGSVGGGAPADVQIRAVAPAGTEIIGDDAFAHGGVIVARTAESPAPAVGSTSVSLGWRFEALCADGEWRELSGEVPTEHAFEGVVGEPTLGYTAIPYRAWIEVVHTVAGWVDGTTADPVEVGGIIVEGIFDDLGLEYDTQWGACTYTDYTWGSWTNGVFDLVGFLRRDKGDVVNCSDCAGILSTYANMVGVDFSYHILTNDAYPSDGFDLNYIWAIGGSGFDETPFDSGDGSFSYHAVTGPDDGTIYDATLGLDGDGTPTSSPFEFIYAEAMAEDDYLFDLSSQWDDVSVDYSTKVRLQLVGKGGAGAWPAAPAGGSAVERAGIPVEALAPEGMSLLSVTAPPAPDHAATLAFGDPSTGEAVVLVDVLVAGDAGTARAALEALRTSTARALPARSGIGDAAYGGAGLLGFARDNVLIAYRAVRGEVDVEALCTAADAAVRAAPAGRHTADPIPTVELPRGERGQVASVAIPGGYLASRVEVDGPAYARRTPAGWLVVRTGQGPVRASVAAIDDRLRATP